MKDGAPQEQFFKFTDRQRRIYEKLQLVGEGTPAFFKDACRLLDVHPPLETFETTTHLVGHLVREIESSLRSVLLVFADSTEESSKATKTKNRETLLDCLVKEFPRLQLKSNSNATQIRQILKGLGIRGDDQIAKLWLEHSPSLAHAWAHRDNLNSPRPADSEFRRYVDEMETVFDHLLSKFESRYSAVHNALDSKLLIEEPTRDDAKWLKTKIPNNRAALGYFFVNLKNPKWLGPLAEEGFFSRPPEPVVDSKRMTFPTWPASKYLLRMATLDNHGVKSKVSEILLSFETSNFLIHLDILEAACHLPASLVGPIADKEMVWLESNPFMDTLVPDKIADLVVHLAKLGDSSRAISLSQLALGFIKDTDEND